MGDNKGSATAQGSQSTYNALKKRIDAAGLWRIPGEPDSQRSHLLGAAPFSLSEAQANQLDKLGEALLQFYKAFNDLYLKRNHAWVNSYLDIGKGDDLLRHAAMKYQRRALPGIIRPDILMTSEGFVITELDSVPGGFGHLDCLSAAYEDAGWDLIGARRGIRDGLEKMLRSSSAADDPVCAIVVSDESVDYLPEMTYIAQELREVGLRAYAVRPKEVIFTEDGLFVEHDAERLRVDVLYRFFELFDLLNIPKAELFAYAAKKRQVTVTPPYKHFLEEKMLLAMLHSDSLRAYWLQTLGQETYSLLVTATAPTWIMDNRPVPPYAQISGFRWRGNPIRNWRDITSATQKERALVLKPSGFSPLAWGARGVKVGHDMPEFEWAQAVDTALESFEKAPYVLQPYRDTALFGVSYFGESADNIREMSARVRLCPYYFVADDSAKLGGVLATACPKNKKLIHGMADAIMAPCMIVRADLQSSP